MDEDRPIAVCHLRDSEVRLAVHLSKPEADVLYVELLTVPGFDATPSGKPQEVKHEDLVFRRTATRHNFVEFEEVVGIPVVADGTPMERVFYPVLLGRREQEAVERGARPREVLAMIQQRPNED